MKRALISLFAVQLGALALTLWASLGVALGQNPESLQTLDALAPLLSLFFVAFCLKPMPSAWRSGCVVALPNIAFWIVMHVFVTTRFLPEFWRDGFAGLGWSHAFWWTLALFCAFAGTWTREKLRFKAANFAGVAFALAVVSLAQLATPRDADTLFERDGTSVRVRDFDLRSVEFGVDDCDASDSTPFDNRNTTWLARAMPRVWSDIQNGGEPLCVVNGGFFGATSPLVGEHEAPLRANGRSLYDVSILENDWPRQNATLVWKRAAGAVQPQILRGVSFEHLKSFDGALGGVRVLILDGQSEPLKPGMGGTTLRCSRTSLAWNRKTRKFWILSVRDPDGEASSVRGNGFEKRTGQKVQVGGWDVAQVQRFWQQKSATDAVLFDGGESGQIAYRDERARWRWTHSSYHLSRTVGFLQEKPLRAVLPMLPPTLANGGVLNWFFVRKISKEVDNF